MLVLGIETSAAICSVSWVQKNKILLEYNTEQPNMHTRILSRLIGEGFNQIGCLPGDLDLICVASGPGSFTGLRIGMAYGKGMSYALDKPLIAVSNFEVLATSSVYNVFPLYTVIDARRDNYFLGIFKKDYYRPDVTEFCSREELMGHIAKGGIIVTPIPGFERVLSHPADFIIARYSAATVAMVGANKFNNGLISGGLNELEPLYIRKFAGAP